MSRTLFWYVFKDLFRVFLLASVCLAGIMSFGGLLRPLTEHGLDASQVTRVLGYFMPAMQTYSLPVAALFATTMVYGRLSADNELTACRAAGIGYWAIWMPAIVLGLIVCFISLIFLCWIVPVFTLKVEKVIYSNLAQLVANEIEHDHYIELPGGNDDQTIFAQKAIVMDPPPGQPDVQVVQLIGPLFVRYERTHARDPDHTPPPPEDFFTASRATAFITQDANGEVRMQAELTDGSKFPRRFEQKDAAHKPMQMSMKRTMFTSDPFPSPVRENVKFMRIDAIKHLMQNPGESRRIRTMVDEFVRDEMEQTYLAHVVEHLNALGGVFEFDAAGGEHYRVLRGTAPIDIHGDRLYIGPTTQPTDPQPRFQQVRTDSEGGTHVDLDATGAQIRLRSWPDPLTQTMRVEADMIDSVTKIGDDATARSAFNRDFVINVNDSTALGKSLTKIEKHDAPYYYYDAKADPEAQGRLRREVIKLDNSCKSELHSRVSFALSCFILVMVGCALGMMFKSGNFLSAFALSVAPALMSIVLVVTGQHICENVPYPIPAHFTNPYFLGVVVIWSGNAIVAVLALVLLVRLSRQ